MSTDRTFRQVALTHSLVGFATCLSLIVFYAGATPFGPINDIGNAVLGLLTIPIARLLPTTPSGVRTLGGSRLAFGVVVVGAGVTVVGTVLVSGGITGFYFAGLWSSFGFALIGVWLVMTHRRGRSSPGSAGPGPTCSSRPGASGRA